MSNWFKFAFSPKNSSKTTMRKEQLKLRTEGNASVAPLASDDSDIENESVNKDASSANGDAFDNLLSSKPDDSTPKKSNGVSKVPTPIPDESDTEKNDTETEGDNEADTTNDLDETAGAKSDNENAENNDEGKDDEEKEEEQFEVEAIVDSRSRKKKTQYLIKWKNYPDEQNTWEFESGVNCPELIAEYLEKNPKKEKKVRISLPSTREAPKRSAAESKSLAESDQESDDSSAKANKSPKKHASNANSPKGEKRGRPKKGSAKATKDEKEYEVEKIVDEKMEGGKKMFRIRWKGYGAKDDTWELKKSLNCPDKIKQYENSKQQADDVEYEVEKIMGEKIEKGKRFFLVKWKNFAESDNTWEAEAGVDCPDLIEKFRDSCRSVGKGTKRPAAKELAVKVPSKSPKKTKKSLVLEEDRDPLAVESENEDEEGDEDDEDEEEVQWEVEKILSSRKKRGKTEFLIKWKNYSEEDATWEPEDGIHCPKLMAKYLKSQKK